MSEDSSTKPIPLRLDKTLLKQLDELAAYLGEPRSTIMRMALRVGIKSLRKASAVELMEALSHSATEEDPSRYPQHSPQYSTVEEKPEPQPPKYKPKKSLN